MFPGTAVLVITWKVVRNAKPHSSPTGSETVGCSTQVCVLPSHPDNSDTCWSLRTTAVFEAPSIDFHFKDSMDSLMPPLPSVNHTAQCPQDGASTLSPHPLVSLLTFVLVELMIPSFSVVYPKPNFNKLQLLL